MPIRMLGLALLALVLACSSRNQPPAPPEEQTVPPTPPSPVAENPASPVAENPASPVAELTGETVTISTVGEFVVGHGAFRLRNAGSEELVAAFDGLWLDVDGQRRPLQLGSIFDEDRSHNLDPGDMRVAAGETLAVTIGFPPFVHEPGASEQTAVVARLRAGGLPLEASSPLRFQRRIPLRPR
jgi:hypothetical protein